MARAVFDQVARFFGPPEAGRPPPEPDYDIFRHTAISLAIAALVEAFGGTKRALLLFPSFVGSVLAGRGLIVGRIVGLAELAEAGLTLMAWIVRTIGGSSRLRVTLITLLFCTFALVDRLAPLQFTVHSRHFGWIPFYSFIYGSVGVNIMSFFEKTFLYGSLVWPMGKAGLRLGISNTLVTFMLFATSWVETNLAGRSAEIADAGIALVLGGIIALIDPESQTTTSLGIGAGLR